ncbi:hypothetical protein EJ05DRAFT_338700 [Pseudovirgaria hyperparasitica]|uniref:Uncharacterized protein n=1 Tax=Pseudovirgaria hyperparasitica TaxID=470096 RepID=A0A6A6WCE6_9PEZI|nr:uncharacterized protein EJ05DRAFT_338700 [Pseudovirgaria hyperparasitica]KAF2759237.1 hypothetical protein EJ05DRAFT_338700 [Pseudovirgaria hyperparasitica]
MFIWEMCVVGVNMQDTARTTRFASCRARTSPSCSDSAHHHSCSAMCDTPPTNFDFSWPLYVSSVTPAPQAHCNHSTQPPTNLPPPRPPTTTSYPFTKIYTRNTLCPELPPIKAYWGMVNLMMYICLMLVYREACDTGKWRRRCDVKETRNSRTRKRYINGR